MVLKYTNNNEEMRQAEEFFQLNSADFKDEIRRLVKMYRWMSILIAAWGILQIVLRFAKGDMVRAVQRGFTFAMMAGLMLLFCVFAPKVRTWFARRSINKKYRKKEEDYEEVVITADSKNMTVTQGKEKLNFRLTEEMDVYETVSCYLLVTKKRDIILPKRIFTKEQFAEFDKLVKINGRLKKTEEKK